MKIVVTGGRDFDDIECVHRTMNALQILQPITLLAHGGATGADTLCDTWARNHGIQRKPYRVPASEWKALGKKAGPLRNQRMLDEVQPDLVVVFPGGPGTADCRRKAEARGLRVLDAVSMEFTP